MELEITKKHILENSERLLASLRVEKALLAVKGELITKFANILEIRIRETLIDKLGGEWEIENRIKDTYHYPWSGIEISSEVIAHQRCAIGFAHKMASGACLLCGKNLEGEKVAEIKKRAEYRLKTSLTSQQWLWWNYCDKFKDWNKEEALLQIYLTCREVDQETEIMSYFVSKMLNLASFLKEMKDERLI